MIELNGISFGYSKKPLFEGLSLRLDAGIYGLLGKNGAGKSSLLRIIAGLLYPRSGRACALGLDPAKRPPELLREIFLVPEELYLPGTDTDACVALYGPFYPGFDRGLFARCLDEFELPAKAALRRLSYGQRKKALLAFALASGARILLLDEPTNGLDIPSKAQFRRLAAASWNEERVFIISTHQVKDVEQLIEPVLILDDGRIIFNQTMEEVSRKLAARITSAEAGGALYSEKTLAGWARLEPASDGAGEEHVDLELLFNGVLANRDKINALFEGASGEVQHE